MSSAYPRSHACITCRRRKVKCDEAKPHCQRCVGRGTLCEGYDSQPERDAKAQQALVKRWRPGPSRVAENRNSLRSLQNVFTVSRQHQEATAPAPQRNRSLEGSANERQLIDIFLHDYMPIGHGPWADQCPWLFEILATQDPAVTPTLAASMRAVTLTRVGRIQNDDAMLAEGRRFYVQALHRLQQLLVRDTPKSADCPILSARALSIYEAAEHSHSFAWLKHQQGLETLIVVRGGDKFVATANNTVLWGLRDASMMKAIILRERSFLNTPPYDETHTSWPADIGSQHNDLRNIGTFFAEILATCNESVEQAGQAVLSLEQAESCWQGMASVEGQLSHWLSRFQALTPQPFYETHVDRSDETPATTNLPHDRVEYRFRTLFDATTMMVYWALQLLLDCLMEEYGELTGMPHAGLGPDEQAARRFTLLANIFRSTAPLLGRDTGMLGGKRALFPWDVAMGMLKKMDGPMADDLFRRGRDAHGKFLSVKGMRIVGHQVDVRPTLNPGERLLLTGKSTPGEPLFMNWYRPEHRP